MKREENNKEKLDAPTDANRGNQTSESTGQEKNQPTLFTFKYRHGQSTMYPDLYFHPVDIDIEWLIQDTYELDPNLKDENNDDEHDNNNEDEVKQEQVNLDDQTGTIFENDEPIINQPPILGDISSQRGLVVRAKYFGISHARGLRFRTAVSKAWETFGREDCNI